MRADDNMDDRTSECTTVLPVMKSRFLAACTACEALREGRATMHGMATRQWQDQDPGDCKMQLLTCKSA